MTITTFDSTKVKILIVDDTPENLEIAGGILEKEKYDIYVADGGQTALELIGNTSFDLILLDIMMPVMDGYHTCRLIKEKPECASIPVIFLTAKADIESVVKGFEYGAVDYIRKPFNALELLARVQTHVELKKMREELEKKNRKLEDAYAALQVIAMTDPLTKLYNRREMVKKLESEKARFDRNGNAFSVIMGDIDYFKKVNDTYGHDGGDYILKGVAEILKTTTRKQDCVSRWGGEEFLLLLPETSLDGAVTLAEKLRYKVENEPFRYNGIDIRITMTFGVSVFSHEINIDALVNLADSALYTGKHNGRNRVTAADAQMLE